MAINIDFDDNKPHVLVKQRFMKKMILWNSSVLD